MIGVPNGAVQKNAALRAARAFAKEQLAIHLQSGCLLDKRLRPRRKTLEAATMPYVPRIERLLAKIDRALDA